MKRSSKKKVVKNSFGSKKAEKVAETISSDSSEVDSEDDAECLYCGGNYTCVLKKETVGLAVHGVNCHRWAHEECAGIGEDDDFIYDICV